MIVYVVKEYNYGRVGGVFSAREMAEWWKASIEAVEPNLMWIIYEFELDFPVPQDIATADRNSAHYWRNAQSSSVRGEDGGCELERYRE